MQDNDDTFMGCYREMFKPFDNGYDFLTNDDHKEYKCYNGGGVEYELE